MSIGSHLYDSRSILVEAIRKIVAETERILNQSESDLSDIFLTSGSTIDIYIPYIPNYHLLLLPPYRICKDAETELTNDLNRETLENAVRSAVSWWERICGTGLGKKKAAKALEDELESLLRETFDELFEKIATELQRLGLEALNTMEGSLQHIFRAKRNFLEELEKGASLDEVEQQKIDDQLVELDRRKLQVEELKAEYDHDLASEARSA